MMKLIKMLGFIALLSAWFGGALGCAMKDGAGERSWTVGLRDQPIVLYRLTAENNTLDTTANFDPTRVVDYAGATVERWVRGAIAMFTPAPKAEVTP